MPASSDLSVSSCAISGSSANSSGRARSNAAASICHAAHLQAPREDRGAAFNCQCARSQAAAKCVRGTAELRVARAESICALDERRARIASGALASRKSVPMPSQFAAQIQSGWAAVLPTHCRSRRHPISAPTPGRRTRPAGCWRTLLAAMDAEDQSGEPPTISSAPCCSWTIERPPMLRDGWPLPGSRAHLLEVVDGLQRLTTLTILFCVLRDLDARSGVRPNAGLLAAIRAGSRLQAPPPAAAAGSPTRNSSRPTCAPPAPADVDAARRPAVAGRGAHSGGARAPPAGPAGFRCRAAAPARRVPAGACRW